MSSADTRNARPKGIIDWAVFTPTNVLGGIVLFLLGAVTAVAVLTILSGLMFVYGADQARIYLTDKFVAEGVYGQILNETARTAGYLDLMTELQQANLILLLCLGALLFIGFVVIEHRLVAIVKLQRRLLEIEEETLELRRRPQKRPVPDASPQRHAQ